MSLLMLMGGAGGVAWNISDYAYVSTKSIATQISGGSGLVFSSDGTKMYTSNTTDNTVYQYTLSTAWDVSTATYANKSFSYVTQINSWGRSLSFSSDGTKMYIGNYNTSVVYQYTLSTAWDVSTATYANKSVSVSADANNPSSLFFMSNGTTLFISGDNLDAIYQYTLSTAWDVSTATYANKSVSVSALEISNYSLEFSDDGTKMYIGGLGNNSKIHQYNLSTAWDVSTATFTYTKNIIAITYTKGINFLQNGISLNILSSDGLIRIYKLIGA